MTAETKQRPETALTIPKPHAALTAAKKRTGELERQLSQLETDQTADSRVLSSITVQLGEMKTRETALMRELALSNDAETRQQLAALQGEQLVLSEKLDHGMKAKEVRTDLILEVRQDLFNARKTLEAERNRFMDAVFNVNRDRLVHRAKAAELELLALQFLSPANRRRAVEPGSAWWEHDKAMSLHEIDRIKERITSQVEAAIRG